MEPLQNKGAFPKKKKERQISIIFAIQVSILEQKLESLQIRHHFQTRK